MTSEFKEIVGVVPVPKLIFIDTEFTDFINIDLISIGAITEDGEHEFYAELKDYDVKASSGFVQHTVEPMLDLNKYGMTRVEASARLFCWLEELGDNFAICPDYFGDWELIADLLEVFPGNIHVKPVMLHTHLDSQISKKAKELQTPDYAWFFGNAKREYTEGFLEYFLRNPQPMQHHALADAKANRHGYFRAMKWVNSHGY